MTDQDWATNIAATDNASASRTTLNDNFDLARLATTAEITNAESPYTAGDVDVIFCDCSSGAVEVDLPAAAAGHRYTIVKVDSSLNSVVIDPDGSETINGAASVTMMTQWQSADLVGRASSWVDLA